MNGYEKRTQAKKDAIVNAARELFTKRGFTDVGIGEIAAAAGVSQVTIYNYFGHKKGLALETLASYLEKAIEEYEEILERDIPFSEKLKILLEQKRNKMDEVVRSYFSELAWDDEALQRVYKEAATTKAMPFYAKFIELGKREGAIDERIPNEAILAYILSSLSIMQHPDYLRTSSEYKVGILRLYFYGLLGKDRGS